MASSSGRVYQVKFTKILAAVVGLVSLISLLGCGDPAIGTLKTITLSTAGGGLVEVKGEGGTLQLTAMGVYTHSQVDITQKVTYNVTPLGVDLNNAPLLSPPQTLTLNSTGLATAVIPFVCTFHNENAGTTNPPAYTLTGSYQVTATFSGVTSNPIFIGVASQAGDGPGGACGP